MLLVSVCCFVRKRKHTEAADVNDVKLKQFQSCDCSVTLHTTDNVGLISVPVSLFTLPLII